MHPISLRAACSAALVLSALAVAQASAAAQSPRHGETRALTIHALPAGRSTMAQLAAYYYGSAQMTFVLQAANPWLEHVSPGRRLAASPRHRTIILPTLRGARPL